MATLKLYELAGADPARLLSPYCWRVRFALAAKGLEAETIVWRMTERDRIAAHGAQKVPVLLHGERAVAESFGIAEYLEDTFPDRPSLFGGAGGRALARFVNGWAEATLMAGLARLIIADIPKVLTPEDAAYFRATREPRFGMALERVQEDRETKVEAFRQAIHPLRMTLRSQPFLGGDAPLQADAIAFGPFQWARVTSPFRPLAPDDPVEAWRQRMLDLHDGMARRVPAFYD
ncbi:glutathione S-transferase family protein [Falsiroseomonas oryziterrae]|uniref:glutathione S-transferase family protein n=1 Tax=Falsiroseomonas oryziterrae TaxID=2911368 RepID=UPI001F1F1333|nr:glutathione S-transferase family protein [Roseomonas sp. NPKOSM-4]